MVKNPKSNYLDKKIKDIKIGYLYITSTKRNIFCTLINYSDKEVRYSCSIGVVKLSKLDEANEYASARLFGQFLIHKLENRYQKLFLILNGLSVGRSAILNIFKNSGIIISNIKDRTRSPHNGCRPSKVRRKKTRTKVSTKIKRLLSPDV